MGGEVKSLVIARRVSDEAIQGGASDWIASRSLSSGRPLRAGHFGPDPLARNNELFSRRVLGPSYAKPLSEIVATWL